jgi:hypothetical protein
MVTTGINKIWTTIKKYWRAELTIGTVTAIAAIATIVLSITASRKELRDKEIDRMHQIISLVSNPSNHREFDNPIGRSLAISELIKLQEKYPGHISAQEMLIAGLNTNSNFKNPNLLKWYRKTYKKIYEDGEKDPMILFSANWYLGIQEYRNGNYAISEKLFEKSKYIANKMDFS